MATCQFVSGSWEIQAVPSCLPEHQTHFYVHRNHHAIIVTRNLISSRLQEAHRSPLFFVLPSAEEVARSSSVAFKLCFPLNHAARRPAITLSLSFLPFLPLLMCKFTVNRDLMDRFSSYLSSFFLLQLCHSGLAEGESSNPHFIHHSAHSFLPFPRNP